VNLYRTYVNYFNKNNFSDGIRKILMHSEVYPEQDYFKEIFAV